jgi:hypothetical protein
MQAETTRSEFACPIDWFRPARAGFDRCGCCLLCTATRESIETFERWRAHVDVDG